MHSRHHGSAARKNACPYHFYISITEVFYIISGEGLLETQGSEWRVAAGDVLVFPPGASGAHLT
ncbi:MAG: cupin domain-containing protein [Coriobacteriales bacterium]|nr:cupin domain-containing protein [Coriobacteriales bacterium]